MTFVYVLSIISATVLGALLGAAVSGLAVLLYLTLRRLRVSETTKQVRSHCHPKRGAYFFEWTKNDRNQRTV